MIEYIVFPKTKNLLKITASSVNVARNKYLKEFPEYKEETLIIVPTSHVQYTRGFSLEQKLYKMSLPEKRTPSDLIPWSIVFAESGSSGRMQEIKQDLMTDGWSETQFEIKQLLQE
jgi:hypothetical protein